MLLATGPEARAADCTATPTPACHLELGKKLLKTDPKRAAQELFASYKLDERTDTLELYASALELDKQYALAYETWERIVIYRGSERTAAKEQRKALLAQRAKRQVDAAAAQVKKLEAKVARVRVRLAPGPRPKVTRDGHEVEVTKEIVVKAGHDELVFVAKDGTIEKRSLVLKAGDNVRIDYPDPAKTAPPKTEPPKIDQGPPPKTEPPTLEPRKLEPQPDSVIKTQPEPAITRDDSGGSRGKTQRVIGLSLLGGAAITAGVATTFGILAGRDFDKAKRAGCDRDGECPVGSAGIDLVERSNDRARLAQIFAAGSVALAGTGVTLWYLGRSKERRSTISVRLAPTSATLAWRF